MKNRPIALFLASTVFLGCTTKMPTERQTDKPITYGQVDIPVPAEVLEDVKQAKRLAHDGNTSRTAPYLVQAKALAERAGVQELEHVKFIEDLLSDIEDCEKQRDELIRFEVGRILFLSLSLPEFERMDYGIARTNMRAVIGFLQSRLEKARDDLEKLQDSRRMVPGVRGDYLY